MPNRRFASKEEMHGWWLGLFLILVGLLWMARDFGMLIDIPFWPTVVILFGLFIIAKKRCCK